MGEVWRARDLALEREVAIKLPRRGRVEEAERWLAAEAQAVARLSHPHLVALLDRTVIPLGGDEAAPALVFELVAGRSLSAFVEKPRPWPWLRLITDQALQGLAYAHGRGVVHRDLKPGNVLLSGDLKQPWVSLLDFGIATWIRHADDGRAAEDPDLAPGTRRYMAPEQALGGRGDLGPWTDLYAWGVVLAELLLGRYPFPGETEDEIWSFRLRTRFTPPVQALADLGVPLRRFLLRLLAPDPAQRFGWAADARRALPPVTTTDLTAGSSFVPESTDVLMEVVRRPEDRDTDPGTGEGTDSGEDDEDGPAASVDLTGRTPALFQPRGSSITMELGPAAEEDVALPQSWIVDRPEPRAWEDGARRQDNGTQTPFPAASYGLLALREPPLHGRTSDWHAAWTHLSRVSSEKRPVVLLIEGPQGRGRTRFAREILAVAEELGVARSHQVRVRADGSGFAALRRLMHRVLRIADLPGADREERLRRVLSESGYPTDADLVPRLLHMLDADEGARREEAEDATTAVELFRVLARRRPLLLFLEDIERARDDAHLQWLQLLLDTPGETPVAVVATTRDHPHGGVGDDAGERLRSRPETLVLPMRVLPDDAIAGVLGFTAGLALDLGNEIARQARGDPRAAHQIARHLHESGRLRWTPQGFLLRADTPSTAGFLKLDAILTARAREFTRASADPEATSTVLDMLALVRERVRLEDLVATADRVGISAARVEAALSPLVLGALVDVRDEGPRLVHTALRGRLADAMDGRRRMAFLRAWAGVLEQEAGGPGHAERLLEAAWQREACGQPGPAARAELQAAHLLRRRGELEAARRAVASAVARSEGEHELLRAEEDADLQVLIAVLDHEQRDPPGSASELSGTLDLLQPLWATLPPSAERCRCDLAHAMAARRAGRPKDALEALQRALDGARVIKAPAAECRAMVALADLLRPPGDLYRSDGLAEQAWKIAEELGDDGLRKEVLLARLPTVFAREELDQARLLLDKLRALLRTRSSWQDLLDLWCFRGRVERLSGQLDAARQAWQSALFLGRRRHLPVASVLVEVANQALEAGDLQVAHDALQEARSDAGTPSHEMRQVLGMLEAERLLRTGHDLDGERALLEVEILLSQAPLAEPRWQRSLARAREAAPGLAPRFAALEGEMTRRLDLGRAGKRRR